MLIMETLAAFALALFPVWVILAVLLVHHLQRTTVWNRRSDTSSLDWGEPGDPQ